jgi:hypothetical protein
MAAVRVQHVAIKRDGDLAHLRAIHDGAKGTADQALDLLGPAGLLAACGLAFPAGMGGAWQHAVFGCDPALAGIAQKRWHAAFNAGGTEHLGVAHADKARAFGVAGESRRQRDGT